MLVSAGVVPYAMPDVFRQLPKWLLDPVLDGGGALMNGLDPDQKLNALAKLKAFVDAEYVRINEEYTETEKAVKEAALRSEEPKPAMQ